MEAKSNVANTDRQLPPINTRSENWQGPAGSDDELRQETHLWQLVGRCGMASLEQQETLTIGLFHRWQEDKSKCELQKKAYDDHFAFPSFWWTSLWVFRSSTSSELQTNQESPIPVQNSTKAHVCTICRYSGKQHLNWYFFCFSCYKQHPDTSRLQLVFCAVLAFYCCCILHSFLTCHVRKITGDTSNITNGSVLSSLTVSHMNNTRSRKLKQPNEIQPSVIVSFTIVLFLLWQV